MTGQPQPCELAPSSEKPASFQVFIKDQDGEMAMDAQGLHWQEQGRASLVLLRPNRETSYNGHVTLPSGQLVHFTARQTRKTDDPKDAALPHFNIFVTDERFNIYKLGKTWRSFDGFKFCGPGGLWKKISNDGTKHYLSGKFSYLGKDWYIHLYYDFRAKKQARLEAKAKLATLPLGDAS